MDVLACHPLGKRPRPGRPSNAELAQRVLRTELLQRHGASGSDIGLLLGASGRRSAASPKRSKPSSSQRSLSCPAGLEWLSNFDDWRSGPLGTLRKSRTTLPRGAALDRDQASQLSTFLWSSKAVRGIPMKEQARLSTFAESAYTLQRRIELGASLEIQATRAAFRCFYEHVRRCVEIDRTHAGVGALLPYMSDETATNVRVDDWERTPAEVRAESGESDGKPKKLRGVTKLIQTHMSISVILRNLATGVSEQFSFPLNTWLQSVDHGKAALLIRCLDDLIAAIPQLPDLLALLEWFVRIPTLDRGSANIKADTVGWHI